MVKVISLTGSFPYTTEHGNTTMLHGDIINHFHHDNGFSNACTPKHPHFTTAWEGDKQINHLDAGFQNPDRCILFSKLGRMPVNGKHVFLGDGSQTVNGFSHNIQNPAEGGFANRHHNGSAGILDNHSSLETVRYIHSNTSDDIVTQMLGHFNHQVVFFTTNGRVGYRQGGQNRRKFSGFKLNVNNGAQYLRYFTYILSHFSLL